MKNIFKLKSCVQHCVFLTALLLVSSSLKAQALSIGSLPQGSAGFIASSAIAKVAAKNLGVKIVVIPEIGTPTNLSLVNNSEVEFAYANAIVSNLGFEGRPPFAKPLSNLRVIAALFPLNVGFLVRADGPIQTFADLQGKRVSAEFITQRDVSAFAKAFYQLSGTNEEHLISVPTENVITAAKALGDGLVDATIASPDAGVIAEVSAKIGGVRYLRLNSPQNTEQILQRLLPGTRLVSAKPRPNWVGVQANDSMLVSVFLLVSNKQIDKRTAYEMAKAIHQNLTELRAAFPAFNAVQPSTLNQPLDLPYHQGALDYYQQAGL